MNLDSKNKLPIIMIGKGGHSDVLADIVALNNKKILKFIEYSEEESFFNTYEPNEVLLINGIGISSNSNRRKEVLERYKNKGYTFTRVIHPSAIISKTVKLSNDIQIMAGVVINAYSKIGINCILNTGVIVDHHCIIEDNIHIAPGAVLCGNVIVESNSFIGANSTLTQNTKITNNTFIKANSLINGSK